MDKFGGVCPWIVCGRMPVCQCVLLGEARMSSSTFFVPLYIVCGRVLFRTEKKQRGKQNKTKSIFRVFVFS